MTQLQHDRPAEDVGRPDPFGVRPRRLPRASDPQPGRIRVPGIPRFGPAATLFLALATVMATVAVLGPIAAFGGRSAALVLVAGVLVLAVAFRPPIAAYAYLILTPLVVGVSRDLFLPTLRLNEALLVVLGAGLLLGAGFGTYRINYRPTRLDIAVAVMAFLNFLPPLLVGFARGRGVSFEDVLNAMTLAKYGVVFLIFRTTIRTPRTLRIALWSMLASGTVLALIAILQSFKIGPIADFLSTYYAVDEDRDLILEERRGTATLSSSIAVGFSMSVHLGVVISMLHRRITGFVFLLPLGGLFLLGGLASGQFSGAIALGVVALSFAILAKRFGRLTVIGVPLAVVAGFIMNPVIQERLSGEGDLPGGESSWDVRWNNLTELIWPRFGFPELLFGVQPTPRVAAPDIGREWIWIESGHTWFLWVGGLPFLLGFFWLMFQASRTTGLVRRMPGIVGATALSGQLAIWTMFAVTAFDPHLTLRGSADIFFPLMGLSLVGSHVLDRHDRLQSRAELESQLAHSGWSSELAGRSPIYEIISRFRDMIAALVLILLLSPLLVITALAIKLTSSGPVFFRQERVGRYEQLFRLYKFRSMKVDNDSSEHRAHVQAQMRGEAEPEADGSFKLKDPRVTAVGGIIRRLSIDELPQLFNVVTGDMSLVGPRPSLDWETEMYSPYHRQRTLVRPGITGLWQVNGRSETTIEDMLDLDIEYLQRQSLVLDVAILTKTAVVIVRGDGAR